MNDDDRTISREEYQRLGANPRCVIRLRVDGIRLVEIDGLTLIGRDPTAGADEAATLITLDDPDRLMSKTHVALDVNQGELIISDRRSVNGTTLRIDGDERQVPAGDWVGVPVGATIVLGDSLLVVEESSDGDGDLETRRVTGLAETASPDPSPSTGEIQWVASATPTPTISANAEQAVPAVNSCASCGRALADDDRFCDGCGAPSRPPVAAPQAASEVVRAPGSRRVPVVAALVVGAAVVAGGVFVVTSRGDDGSIAADRLRGVPPTGESVWRASVAGASSVVADAGTVYVIAIDEGDAEVVALARADGEERWSSGLDNDKGYGDVFGPIDGRLIARVCDFDGVCGATAIDTSNGEAVWNDELDGSITVVGDALMVQSSGEIERLNAADGTSQGRVRADSIIVEGQYVYSVDDDGREVEVFNLALESVFGPIEIDEDHGGLAFNGSQLLVATDEDLLSYDAQGDVTTTSQTAIEFVSWIQLGPGGTVVLIDDAAGELVVARPTEPRMEELWSSDGYPSRIIEASGETLIAVSDDGDLSIVELESGDERIRVDDTATSYGSNGFLTYTSDESGDTDVVAYRYSDGEELWDTSVEGGAFLIDGALVAIADGDVELYR
jgi:outer membrane protein assembly factor BamB